MPKVRQLVVNDVVCRIAHLLDHNTITTPKVGHPEITRRVLPGDIAVLVPSHAEAHNVASALRRSGIPAVRTRTGSVLATPAVTQWRLLLTAIARPHQASAARAAAMGWFLATDPTELCGDQADTVLAQLQERIASMADRLNRFGLPAFYHEQKSSGTLVHTVLSAADGDRHLTDLDHIAEFLSASLHDNSCEPTRVLRVLDEMIATDNDLSDATMRRIESDAKAIQITTIHSAKGLEYPIVLVPFGFKARPNSRKPFSFTDPAGFRMLDIAPAVAWDDGLLDPNDATTVQHQESRKRKAQVDTDGDALRLLYVALTRAEHRLEVWWAATQGATASALGRVLLDRTGDGPVENSQPSWKLGTRGGVSFVDPPFVGTTPDNAIAQIHHLADTSNGAIAVHELADALVAPSWSGRTTSATDALSTASRRGRAALADHAWKRWSFTRLSGLIDARTDATDAEQASDEPVRGGADEPTTAFNSEPALIPASKEPDSTGGIVAHLADVKAGTAFGTFVHAVLEDIDFTSSELSEDLRALVRSHAQREGLRLDSTPVVDGLVAALRTPLGPLFDQCCLSDFAPHDRLAELTFDMPLGGGLASTQCRLPARSIADILLSTLPADDAMRPFATQLATDSASIHIAGWMNGSIDAVVRVPHGNDYRFMVIDYKTNRLHQPGSLRPVDAYHPSLLVHAMNEHRYPLQALLYSVAVHRYLRWRLGAAYDPEAHLGGIGYLFVRGMVGPNTPTVGGVAHGVFSWRPPTDAICALDELFATGDPS